MARHNMASTRIERVDLGAAQYEYGGDDYVLVQTSEEMSFDANFKAQAVCQEINSRGSPGLIEVAPANASYLIHFDPAELHPDDLIEQLETIEEEIDLTEFAWDAKVIDIPVLFNDPWTHETLMRFRDRHQDPDGTDLDYSAKINGFDDAEGFIDHFSGSPHLVTMVGFVPGLPWAYLMVPREDQIEVPKYVQPRTDTPGRAIGFGGAFSVVYPVRGAGGYQLYGRTPVEVLDVDQQLPDFQDSMVLPSPGDILFYRRIDRDEYDEIRESVESNEYEYDIAELEFSTEEFFEDPYGYNEEIREVLYG